MGLVCDNFLSVVVNVVAVVVVGAIQPETILFNVVKRQKKETCYQNSRSESSYRSTFRRTNQPPFLITLLLSQTRIFCSTSSLLTPTYPRAFCVRENQKKSRATNQCDARLLRWNSNDVSSQRKRSEPYWRNLVFICKHTAFNKPDRPALNHACTLNLLTILI